MQLRCPKCDTVFNAKANARRIKCPGCTFRQDTPADGFPAARKGAETFTLVSSSEAVKGIPTAGRATMIAVVALLVVAALAAAWYFTQGSTPATDGTGTHDGEANLPPAPASAADCKTAPRLAAGLKVAAVMETNMGTIRTDLYPDQAPVTVANLVCLARAHFYDGLHFHRIITGFMMQGGDPQGTGGGGPGYAIKDEFTPSLRFDKPGVLAMANSGPDTGGSQFFITFAPTSWLNDHHSIFGQVTADTMAVVHRVETEAGAPDPGTPKVPVTITKMTIEADGITATSGASTPPSTSSSPPGACHDVPNAARPSPGPVELDLITPGVWNVCADKEYSYVWVHNNGTSPLAYAFEITGQGGVPLPAGWSVSFMVPQGNIQDTGAKQTAWAATQAILTIPANQPAGTVSAELHAGGATRAFTFHVQSPRGRVAVSTENLQTHYDLDDSQGNVIQHNGDFCVTLGPNTNAVLGYAWGLIGVAKGETVTLFVPQPFAYGYGSSGLGGKTLVWKATVNGYSTAPPDQKYQCPQAT